jgi:hypothetical protein
LIAEVPTASVKLKSPARRLCMPRVLPSMKTRSISKPYFLNKPASLAIQAGTEELGESEM